MKSVEKPKKKPTKPLKIVDKPLDYTKYIKEIKKQREVEKNGKRK